MTILKQYYDLIIAGGGPAGVCAGISAARQGLSTLIIEAGGCLGGMWTSGMTMYAMDTVGKKGIMEEIRSKLEQRHAYDLEFPERGNFLYDSEVMKSILDDLCDETSIEIMYYGKIIHAVVSHQKVRCVTAYIQGTIHNLEAGLYIDATGNGDLGSLCKCSYEMGNPEDGKLQPATLCAYVTGVPKHVNYEFTDEKKTAFLKLLKSLGFTPSYQAPSLIKLLFKEGHLLGTTHLYDVDCTKPETIAAALKEGRRQIFEAVKALQKQDDWDNVKVAAISDYLGIREGRRLEGLYRISKTDIIEGKRFEDGICMVHAGVDIHALAAGDLKGYSDGNVKSKPFHIPYRSLVSKDVSNLGFAGRCISGDFYSHAAYRMTGNCAAMGEAIGFAAALVTDRKANYASIDGKTVSDYMKKQGYLI